MGITITRDKEEGLFSGYAAFGASRREYQESVQGWFRAHLRVDARSSERLTDLYQFYRDYCNNFGVSGCSKPVFSRILKNLLEEDLSMSRVKIITRSGLYILGVRFDETDEGSF